MIYQNKKLKNIEQRFHLMMKCAATNSAMPFFLAVKAVAADAIRR
jgi:hypothetical protein